MRDETTSYCLDPKNHVIIERNEYYESLKSKNKIRTFYELPESWQDEFKRYVSNVELRHGKIEYILLVGSLSSGSGIVPGWTTEEFKQARKKYSHKTRKKKSDIDLHIVGVNGEIILESTKSSIVNIESLPVPFEPYFKIYENGEWK